MKLTTARTWDLKGRGRSLLNKEKTKNWKAVRGVWDGSTKTNGRIGCGVVIPDVDRDKWITINRNCRTLENVYGNGSGSGRCLCSYWNHGLRVGEKHQYESH